MRSGQVRDTTIAQSQVFQNPPAGWVSEGGEGPVQRAGRTFNHMVNYSVLAPMNASLNLVPPVCRLGLLIRRPFSSFLALMNVLRFTDPGYDQRLEQIASHSSLFDSVIDERTRAIVEDVRKRGDEALLELTARFDGAHLRLDQLPVTTTEKFNASLLADEELREAVEAAHRNIQAFSRKSLRKNWTARNRENARVGEKFDPFGRVGIYIPGGTAPRRRRPRSGFIATRPCAYLQVFTK